MRVAAILTAILLTACAGEKLALAPPPGIDFSGRWRLNEADSDDAQRLIQNQMGGPGSSAPNTGGSGGSTGRTGGRGGGPPAGPGGPADRLGGPVAPGFGAMSAGLRWPGRDLEVKQVAGVVAFTSDGVNRVYQPADGEKRARPPQPPPDAAGGGRDRNMHGGRGDAAPGTCGWDDKTLVLRSFEPEDDRPAYEERYALTADGQRLIEVVGFKGGRSAGYTLSRVWDRVAAAPRAGAAVPVSGIPSAAPPDAPATAK